MAKVSSATSTNPGSGDPESVKAWEQAEKDAKDAGIRWEKPADDKRSAEEIMRDTSINEVHDTKIQTADGKKRTVEEVLKEKVGDYETDEDAAYRAAQVLEHIEKFDENGKRIAGNTIDNGEVDGFSSKGDAYHGTEAGRLQDFGKYGFTHLKGKLNDVTSKSEDPEARKKAEALGIKWERPEGDDRSAGDILNGDRLLKDLGNQSDVKDMLKEQVGDFEKDADAAYRASQVLDHIEKFDRGGKRLVGGDVGDSKINGFSNSGEAYRDKEAGRLQDFGKYGFDSLKGKLEDYKNAGNDKDERKRAEEDLGIKWERPEDDKRSAKDIIEGDPLFQQLGDHSGIRDLMKERIGDFDKDADAAYRAEQILRHVELYDSNGKELSGGDVGNGEINGFSKDREAYNGTEAGRLQDFAKDGFSALKGNLGDIAPIKGKAEDTQSYKDFLKANPDADEGSKQVAKYTAILRENYDTIREKSGGGDYLDADALKRYVDTTKGLSDETKEALNFWSQPGTFDMIDNAKHSLSQRQDGDVGKGDIDTWLGKSAPKDPTSLMSFLSESAGRSAFADIDTSKLDKSIFSKDSKHSNEEKAAVLQELLQAQQLMVDGASAGMWKDDYSKVSIANRANVHPDKDKVFEDLNEHIKILQDNPEVVKTLNEKTSGALKSLVEDNKGLKDAVQTTYDKDIKSGDALNASWDKNMKDGKAGQQAVLADFVGTAQSYQAVLGIEKPQEIKEAIVKSDHEGDFKDFYEKKLVSGDRLNELLKENSFDKAGSVFNMEVALYGSVLDSNFTAKHSDKLDENFSKIANDNILKGASFEDLKKAFGVNGTDKIDDEKVLKYLEEASKENPELFINENGKPTPPDQILAGFRGSWDLFRQGTKTLDKVPLKDVAPSSILKEGYDKGVLHGVSGLVLAGITIARGIGTNGNPAEKDIVNITAGSIATATILTEGGMKGYSSHLNTAIGKAEADLKANKLPVSDWITNTKNNIDGMKGYKDVAKKFEEGAKGLGGAAGVVMGAYGIFDGKKMLDNGDTVGGVLSITSGSMGAMAGLASMVEGAWGLGNAILPQVISKVPNMFAAFAGALGWAAAGVGVIVSFLPALIEEGKHQKRSDDFGDTLGTYLTKYEIDGVKDGDIGDIPDEDWPGYDPNPTSGS